MEYDDLSEATKTELFAAIRRMIEETNKRETDTVAVEITDKMLVELSHNLWDDWISRYVRLTLDRALMDRTARAQKTDSFDGSANA